MVVLARMSELARADSDPTIRGLARPEPEGLASSSARAAWPGPIPPEGWS